jgi:hypothetical protein
MRPVKRVVKWVCWLVWLFVVLLPISVICGLTPYPKPPKGVRLAPVHPPLARENLRPDNGAFHYMKAAEYIQSHPLAKEPEAQIEAVAVGIFSGDTNTLSQTAVQLQEPLDLVRQGSHAPSCQMPRIDLHVNLSVLSSMRHVARFLLADGELAERNGDYAKAIDDYLTAVKLGTDCAKGGPIIMSLVGNAIISVGTQSIRHTIRRKEAPANLVEAAQSKLEQLRTSGQAYDETLRYELLSSKQMFEQTFAQANRLWMTTQTRNYSHLADAAFGELIEDANRPFGERQGDAIIHKWTQERRPVWTWIWNRPIARILLTMMLPTTDASRQQVVRTDVDFQATITACALRRYELTNGNPPDHLTDLVPDTMPSVPIDPFDGKPLRCRREGKEWVIWSVGSDLKDDSAAWHEFKYQTPGEERKGGDIYFKSTDPLR